MLPKRKTYEVERLLTPAVEFYSVVICLVFAIFLSMAPGLILMTPPVAYSAAAILVYIALHRMAQGYQIIKYQRGLKKLPFYSMAAKDLPVSHKKLFLGKGFRWRAKHVERLRDIHNNDPDKWLSPSRLYRFVRWLELKFEYTPFLKSAVRVFSINVFFNPVKPLPAVGGSPEIHAVGLYEGERDILMDIGERVGHTLVLGTTRVGKTRLAEIFITQDIRRGDVVIVFDPKGDADLMKRVYGEAKKAARPIYIFHLGYPDISARYNPVGDFSRITEVASRIADQLPSEGNSAAFKMFGWRFVNIVAQALVKLGERPDYPSISRHILSIDKLFVRYAHYILKELGPQGWAAQVQVIQDNVDEKGLTFALKGRDHGAIALMRYIENSELYDSVLDGLLGAFKYDKTYFDKIVSSLAPLLEQLTSGRTAELLAPEYYDTNDIRPIFDWKSVIQQKAVVYVGLDALSDAVVGGAIGASMFADLTSVAGSLYKHGLDHGQAIVRNKKTGEIEKTKLPKIALHADEFNEIVGDQFIPMLNKAGGAGFQVTAYTQTAADILAGIGDAAKAGQIEGNFNTLIMLRVKTKATAEFLTDQLADVQVSSVTSVTSAGDSSDVKSSIFFTAQNQDREVKESVPMLVPNNVISLPKGQAFALIEGGQLYKLRLPLPEDDDDLPDGLEAIASDMRSKYSSHTPEDWFSAQDYGWYRDVSQEVSHGE